MAIGIFDSGVGGLSVLRHLVGVAPLIYLADQAYAPYGERSLTEVRARAIAAADYLLTRGSRVVVVACNTASAAALEAIRERHHGLAVVGMEPAVKPAARSTRSGTVAVLATAATFQGELYSALTRTFGGGIEIVELIGTGLAAAVEEGHRSGTVIDELLAPHYSRVFASGADTLVLGCTHYPFLIEALRQGLGPRVDIVNPAPAVARQAQRVLAAGATPVATAGVTLLTTGNPTRFARQARDLVGLPGPVERVTITGPVARG